MLWAIALSVPILTLSQQRRPKANAVFFDDGETTRSTNLGSARKRCAAPDQKHAAQQRSQHRKTRHATSPNRATLAADHRAYGCDSSGKLMPRREVGSMSKVQSFSWPPPSSTI